MRAVIKGEGNSWTRRIDVWSWRGIERLQVDAPTTELCVSENAPGMNTSIIFGKDSGIWTHSLGLRELITGQRRNIAAL